MQREKQREQRSLKGTVHRLSCYKADFSQPFLYPMWAAQTPLLNFAPGPLPISSSTLTPSRRSVPVEAADEEAMPITWPGLSTMI